MSESFDPYRKWLGIPPSEQPPHHYRLLGMGLFEDDADVIEEAADRQMAHVQTHKTGPHSALSQKLLNELAAAKLCLLDRAQKAAYDAALGERLAPPAAPPQPKPLPVASRVIVEDEAPGGHEPLVFTPAVAMTVRAARRAKLASRPAGVAGVVVAGVLTAAAAVYFLNGVRTAHGPPNNEGRKAGAGSKAQGQKPKVADAAPGSKFQVADSKPKAATRPGPEIGQAPIDASAAAPLPSPPAASPDEPPPETEPRETIDLLKLIDLSRDVIAGEWRIDGRALVSPHAGGIARIELPYDVPREYDVTIGVKRLAGSDTLGIYLPIDGAQALVALDSGLAASGIHRIDGQANSGNETTRRGHFLGGGVAHTLRCSVRGNRLRLSCDGETVIEWQGDVKRLSIDGGWAVRRADRVCLASDGTSYEFGQLELTVSHDESSPGPVHPSQRVDVHSAGADKSPDRAGRAEPPPSGQASIDLLERIDTQRDAVSGEWRMDGGALVTPSDAGARLQLPATAPPAYRVSAVAERLQGTGTFGVGLVVDGAHVLAAIDAYDGTVTGLDNVDEKPVNDNETTFRGSVFQDGAPNTIEYRVWPARVQVTVNGKPCIDWTGDARRLTTAFPVPDPGALSLVVWGAVYRITKLELSPLGDLAARQPAPDEKQLREAEKRVRQLFKAERAAAREPSGKLALASLLREAAAQTKTPPGERFAMLREAIDQAADTCDYGAAVQAVLDLADGFDVSPLPLKADALTRANRAGKSVEQKLWLFDAALVLVAQAAAADDFETAERVAKLAATMVRSVRDPERSAELKQRTHDLAEMARQHERHQAAARPDWLQNYASGLDREREIDTRVAARPLALPPKFDLARSWTLSLELLRSNPAGDNGQVFFIGDGRPGCDPIAIWISGHRLHVRISNSADAAKHYLLTHDLAASDVGRWQRLQVTYEAGDRSALVELDGRRVAAGVCPFDPGIDRPMEIWIGGAGAGDQRFLGQVRMVLLAND